MSRPVKKEARALPLKKLRPSFTLKDSDVSVTTLVAERGEIMMGDRTHLGDHQDFGSLADGWDEKNGTDTKRGDFKDN